MYLTTEQCQAIYGPTPPIHDPGWYHTSVRHYEDVQACDRMNKAFADARSGRT
jgi:hypothetical protein